MSEEITGKLTCIASTWSSVSGTCVQNTEVLGEFLPQVRRGGEVCMCVQS